MSSFASAELALSPEIAPGATEQVADERVRRGNSACDPWNMDTTGDATDLATWYVHYNGLCNSHSFGLLADFVHRDVRVNGEVQGLKKYVSGLEAVVDAFPDYRWELQHLVVSGDWIAALS